MYAFRLFLFFSTWKIFKIETKRQSVRVLQLFLINMFRIHIFAVCKKICKFDWNIHSPQLQPDVYASGISLTPFHKCVWFLFIFFLAPLLCICKYIFMNSSERVLVCFSVCLYLYYFRNFCHLRTFLYNHHHHYMWNRRSGRRKKKLKMGED